MFHRSTYVFLPKPRVLTTATVSNIVKSASGGFKQKHNDTSWQSITLSQGEHKVRDKRYQVRQQGSSEQGAGIRLAKIADTDHITQGKPRVFRWTEGEVQERVRVDRRVWPEPPNGQTSHQLRWGRMWVGNWGFRFSDLRREMSIRQLRGDGKWTVGYVCSIREQGLQVWT